MVEPPTELEDGRYSFTATDEPAEDQSPDADNVNIYFSGGKVGCQVRMAPDDLGLLVPFRYADLTV